MGSPPLLAVHGEAGVPLGSAAGFSAGSSAGVAPGGFCKSWNGPAGIY